MRYNHHGVISRIDELSGCSQVAVFNSSFVLEVDQRRKGLGTTAHGERIKEALKLGYDAALCTVIDSNKAEIAILKKFKWVKLAEFHSSKTNNNVQIWFLKFNEFLSENSPCLDTLEYRQYDEWEKSLERPKQ